MIGKISVMTSSKKKRRKKQMSEIGLGRINNLLNRYNTTMTNLQSYKANKVETETNTDEDIAVIYERTTSSVKSYGLYSVQKTSSAIFNCNQDIQNALSGLGFYSGPPDGSLTSERMEKAIKNFQRVYGIKKTGEMDETTQMKLKKATTMRKECIMDSDFDNLVESRGFDTKQKSDFLNTWTFLRVGMGLSRKQAAGVCGNIVAESKFSSDNAEDGKGYKGIHDTKYKYKVDDRVGYGLLQWTDSSRKQELKDMAKKMKLDVSDINAQLAHFRNEVINGDQKNAWKKIKKCDSYEDASDIFLKEIENPKVLNYKERRGYAKNIYQYMKSH